MKVAKGLFYAEDHEWVKLMEKRLW